MKKREMWSASRRVLVLTLAILCAHAHADTWGPPRKEHWSANKRFVLKVQYPARSNGLSFWERTEGGLKQHWRRPYVHRVWPPHRAYVTDDGKYVVLRDVYHNLGHGKVIVILGENGDILGDYELRDFLPQDEIRSAIHTVSSICWDDSAWYSFINNDRQFALVTQHGTVRCFDLPTGKMLDLSDEERAKIVDLVRQEAEAWVQSEGVASRVQGITLLGGLGIKEAVPVAMKLFRDKRVTGSVGRSGRPGATTHHVQKAAALALVRLLGAEAIPSIEQELSEANWHMKGELMKVLTRLDVEAHEIVDTPNSEAAFEMWKRLAEHASDDIRYPALRQVLLRDDGTYLLEHADLVECNDDRVRRIAIDLLSKMSFPEALPLLQRAVRESVRSSLKPPDDDAKRRRRYGEFGVLCGLVAERKLSGVKVELERARSAAVYEIQIPATGALAALGDKQALEDLHRLAREGEFRARNLALDMCGYVADEASMRLLKQAAESSDPQVSFAAKRTLARIKGIPPPPPPDPPPPPSNASGSDNR